MCPLCYSTIEEKELKSCRFVPLTELTVGKDIELKLVIKEGNEIKITEDKSPKKYDTSHVQFTRITKTLNIDSILSLEEKSLQSALWLAKSCQELEIVPFIEMGLNEISKRSQEFKKKYINPIEIEESKKSAQQQEYYIYQIPTGENAFLLPLNFKCILDEYGECDSLPISIKGKILEITRFQLDQHSAKRYK